MARFYFLTFLILFSFLFSSLITFSDARKLHIGKHRSYPNGGDTTTTTTTPSSPDSLFLSALPKGTIPSSSPSKKGHAVVVDEKLIARHLIAIDRLLRSVPSPGAGH